MRKLCCFAREESAEVNSGMERGESGGKVRMSMCVFTRQILGARVRTISRTLLGEITSIERQRLVRLVEMMERRRRPITVGWASAREE